MPFCIPDTHLIGFEVSPVLVNADKNIFTESMLELHYRLQSFGGRRVSTQAEASTKILIKNLRTDCDQYLLL